MANEQQQTQVPDSVDVTQLQGALDNLTRIASSTQLNKGGIANSGTYSDGKPSGGGQGSMADAGGIDDLMIGKMTAAGFDAATIANFRAFMEDKKKKEKGEQPSMPPFGKSETAPQTQEPGKLAKSLTEDPEISEAMDASPFMEALVARTTGAIDTLEKSLHAIEQRSCEREVATARAMLEIGKLVKSQASIISELGKRLGVMERAPVAQPKGRTGTNGAQPLNKSGVDTPPGGELRKSEVLSTLTYMNLEKGIKNINGVPTYQLAGMFEGGNIIDEHTLGAVRQFLAENPREAQAAKSYT